MEGQCEEVTVRREGESRMRKKGETGERSETVREEMEKAE